MATMMSMDEAIAGWLIAYRGPTLARYRTAVRAWLRWCDLNGVDPMTARRSHLETWCAYLARTRSETNTRNTLSCVRSFYHYLAGERIVAQDPSEHLRLPRQYRHSTGTYLTAQQAARFLDAARDMGRQEYALCTLLLLAGPRIGEALGLDVEDWNPQTGTVRYARKGHYMQEVHVAAAVRDALTAHLGRRRHGPIFRGPKNRRMSQNRARNIVRTCGARIGVLDITPHSLRRTFCTLAVDAGVPERDIMTAAGWTSQNMLIYYDMQSRSITQQAGDAVAHLLDL
ncbi:MAG: tyrosine-type recombinase/integrase [Bifidobacterium castoris]|nr:tyrosine-type recombinase/integrase [Bifidobacterium castoris]